MIRYRLALPVTLFLCSPGLVVASENVEINWQLSSDNLSHVQSLLPDGEKPTEMTQLLREIRYQVKSDTVKFIGKSVNYYPRFIDAKDYGTVSVYFNPNYESLRILSVASISPEGEVMQISPSDAQILDVDEYNTFNSEKEVALAIPGLKEGSFSVLEYEIVTQKNRMESDWSQELYVQNNYPINQFSLDVFWEESSPITWALDSKHVQCEEQENQLSCQGSELPLYKGDTNAYWRDHVERISIGVNESWNQVIEQASELMAKANDDVEGLDELYGDLTKGSTSKEENIAAILDFVSRDIRYVSMSDYGNAMTPHTIGETIKNRYGDCKDKSVLLKALLEKNGIPARLVLVSTYRTDNSKLLIPTMNAYNHVVVCFKLNGEDYCVDPTDTQTNWQYVSSWIQNKVSLPLELGFVPSPLDSDPYRWKLNIVTETEFLENGGQSEHQTRTYLGEYASSFRSSLYSQNKADRHDSLLKQYQEVVYDQPEPSFTIRSIDEMTEELEIESNAEILPFLETDQPLTYAENDAWLRDEIVDLKLKNERFPEYFPGLSVYSEYNYDTNDVWKITDIPPTLRLNHKLGSLTRNVTQLSPTKLKVLTTVDIRSQFVDVSAIEEFNKLLDTFIEHSTIRFYGSSTLTK
ncbi:DUF3857 domain-containing transglutaminase family protein [Vibrio sp. HN007]|uniref:DUF3857 domain-containing transglutaminase family protein n=1 Tax=Vibrio iocasae TaxID=3098914 RepID=UPI0035D4D4D1